MTEKSLENLGVGCIDLQQFHVWEDSWARNEQWRPPVEDLKREGLVRAIGISVNRWEPWNALETVRSGLIDTVQVIYNIFDQAPEDELFPLCRQHGVGVIARVPFDEGTLTGRSRKNLAGPRAIGVTATSYPRISPPAWIAADRLKPLLPAGMTMAEVALRWILANERRQYDHPRHAGRGRPRQCRRQ